MGNIAKYVIQATEKDISHLINDRVILRPMKPLYWSFYSKQQQTKAKILQQCPQLLKQKSLQEITSLPLSKLSVLIKQFYMNKKVNTLMIIDQINILAGFFRDYNNKVIKKEEQLDYLMSLNKKRQNIGYQVIYNSSVNIERVLLNKPVKQDIITMAIQTHRGSLNQVRIPYQHRINTEKGFQEILAFIKFIANQKGIKLSTQQEQIIKKKIITIKNKSYLQPLKFRQGIKQINDIVNQIESIIRQSTNKFQLQTDRFIFKLKKSNDRYQIAAFGLILMRLLSFLRQDKNQQFIISTEQVNQIKQKFGINKQKLDQLFDKNIFLQQNGSYICLTSKDWLLQFIHKHSSSFYVKFIQLTAKTFHISSNNHPAFGCIFQLCFLVACVNGIQKKQFIHFSQNKQKTIVIQEISTFICLNIYKNDDINQPQINYMQKIINISNTNPGKYILGIPVKRSSLNKTDSEILSNLFEQRSLNSKCVDFCLLFKENKTNIFHMTFFDIKTGITQSSSKVQQVKEFDNQLKMSFSTEISAKTEYVIFCRNLPKKNHIVPNKGEKNQFIIRYITYQDFQIRKILEEDQQILNKLKILIKQIKLQKTNSNKNQQKIISNQDINKMSRGRRSKSK